MVSDINATVALLEESIPKLGPKDQAFAQSLADFYLKHHKLTPSQLYWADKLITKVAHEKEAPKVDVGGFEGVVALFQKSKEHLKNPKIILICEGKTLKLSLAGEKSKVPGSINVVTEGVYPQRVWYGRVSPEGQWTPSNAVSPQMQTALQSLLKTFGEQPALVAKQYGKLTGNCCFCGKVLTHKSSTAAGFGPICAGHYGLTAEWVAAASKEILEGMTNAFTSLGEATEKSVESSKKLGDALEKAIFAEAEQEVTGSQLIPVCVLCEVNDSVIEVEGGPVCRSCAKELGLGI